MTPFLDQSFVSRALFYPRREEGIAPLLSQRLAVVVDPEVRVYGYLHLTRERAPLLLLFHGNGELAVDYSRLAVLFTQLGFSLFVVDYRGYGISDGEPSTSHLLSDAVTVFDALPELLPRHGSRPRQTFVMGRSLGSVAACELAFRRGDEIAGLIIESGFAFTEPLLVRMGVQLENYEELRDGHGNGRKIACFSGPTLILHGQDDTLISPEQARALYDLSATRKKRLVIIPNANHNNLMSVGYVDYSNALQFLLSQCGPQPEGVQGVHTQGEPGSVVEPTGTKERC